MDGPVFRILSFHGRGHGHGRFHEDQSKQEFLEFLGWAAESSSLVKLGGFLGCFCVCDSLAVRWFGHICSPFNPIMCGEA